MDEYVIVEKSSLNNIADTVRGATGSTDSIAVSALSNEVAAAIASGGLPSGGAPYQQLVTDGEGNAKWEDRLCYTSDPVSIAFIDGNYDFDCGTINGGDGSTVETLDITIDGNLADGENYILTIDDQVFNVIAKSFQGHLYIGNAKYMGGEDTGENYFIFVSHNGMIALYGWATEADIVAGTTNHTIKLEGSTTTNYPIDIKYLPRASENSLGVMNYHGVRHAAFRRFGLVEGQTTFKEAVKIVQNSNGNSLNTIYISGKDDYLSLYGGIYNTTKIRIYAFNSELTKRVVITLNFPSASDDAILSSIEVTEQNIALDGNSSIILNSSTSGSSKKFKITVDDSGTISATEVT